MKNGFDLKLKQCIGELESHLPDDSMWTNITTQLNSDAFVLDAIDALPTYEPAIDLWDRIEPHIVTPKRSNKNKYIIQLAVAASLAVLIVRTILIETEKHALQIETEWIYTAQYFSGKEDGEIISKIEQYCSEGNTVCVTEQFEEKIALYYELTNELIELQKVIQYIGESPEMIQSVRKIEVMKSDTIQELLALVKI